jgi:hypothetical protein
MTSLFIDTCMMVGSLSYGLYLLLLIHKEKGAARVTQPAKSLIGNGFSMHAFTTLGVTRRSLAFQRVGRRI